MTLPRFALSQIIVVGRNKVKSKKEKEERLRRMKELVDSAFSFNRKNGHKPSNASS